MEKAPDTFEEKTMTSGNTSSEISAEIEFYETIKAAELGAERLQVRRLADDFLPLEGPGWPAVVIPKRFPCRNLKQRRLSGGFRKPPKPRVAAFPIIRIEDLKTS